MFLFRFVTALNMLSHKTQVYWYPKSVRTQVGEAWRTLFPLSLPRGEKRGKFNRRWVVRRRIMSAHEGSNHISNNVLFFHRPIAVRVRTISAYVCALTAIYSPSVSFITSSLLPRLNHSETQLKNDNKMHFYCI